MSEDYLTVETDSDRYVLTGSGWVRLSQDNSYLREATKREADLLDIIRELRKAAENEREW
jgi:hypothetical protein